MNEVQASCGHIINKLLRDPTGHDECLMDLLEETKCRIWEVLYVFDSEAMARVSGVAETVDYFG